MSDAAADFELPEFEIPQQEHAAQPVTWEDAMRELEPLIKHYLLHFDDPYRRFAEKSPAPFVL